MSGGKKPQRGNGKSGGYFRRCAILPASQGRGNEQCEKGEKQEEGIISRLHLGAYLKSENIECRSEGHPNIET